MIMARKLSIVLWLLSAFVAPAMVRAAVPESAALRVAEYLESLKTPNGLYGWEGDDEPHLVVTRSVLRTYSILGLRIPGDHAEMARQVVRLYPFDGAKPENARTRWHAAHLCEFETMAAECARMLSGDMKRWRNLAETGGAWQKIDSYMTAYEADGNPIFVQQMQKLKIREVTGALASDATKKEFARYLAERERGNGTFNTSMSTDGSDGHLVNTYWGLYGKRFMGLALNPAAIDWIGRCQLPCGGFTWTPDAEMPGRVADVVYAHAAVGALAFFNRRPPHEKELVEWLLSLRNPDGGFGDRPGARSNALATCAALETLAALGRLDSIAEHWPCPRQPDPDLDSPSLKAFTIQFEAPGSGSVKEAVEVAKDERIHLWGAKNAEPAWIKAAQKEAHKQNVPVEFFRSDERYGERRSIPGLGSFTHVVDPVTPPPSARDQRPFQLWQICDHECFARVMLDSGAYDAIGTFHFGCHDMTWLLPFVRRYEGELALVSNQDSHGETWWWRGMLRSFRTIFLAEDASWDSFRDACRRHLVASVREDSHTGGRIRLIGCAPHVRKAFMDRIEQWRQVPRIRETPRVSIQVLDSNDVFEVAHPSSGRLVRVRLDRRWVESKGLQRSKYRLESVMLGDVALPIERKEFRHEKKDYLHGILEEAYDIVKLPEGAEGEMRFCFKPDEVDSGLRPFVRKVSVQMAR